MFILIGSIAFEDVFSMCINLDVMLTLKNSFERSKNLKLIIIFEKTMLLVILIGFIVVTNDFLKKLEADWQTPEKSLIDKGLYEAYDLALYYFIIPLEILYIFIMLISVIITLSSLYRNWRKRVMDETHSILRRQMIYFMMVNFYEIPFKSFCLINTLNITRMLNG